MVTIVNDGLEFIAKLINGVSLLPMKYCAIGSGTTAESNTQTALVTEMSGSGASRKESTCAYEADYKSKWTTEFTNGSGGTWSVNEFAILNTAVTGGKMMMRHKYTSTQSVLVGQSIEITYTQTVTRV